MSIPDPADVTHAPYRREPYVRVQWEGGTVDAKAVAWTRMHVLVHWEGETVHDHWVPAADVRRITREESRWRDPYDLLR